MCRNEDGREAQVLAAVDQTGLVQDSRGRLSGENLSVDPNAVSWQARARELTDARARMEAAGNEIARLKAHASYLPRAQ